MSEFSETNDVEGLKKEHADIPPVKARANNPVLRNFKLSDAAIRAISLGLGDEDLTNQSDAEKAPAPPEAEIKKSVNEEPDTHSSESSKKV
jgi:hypothetical protein